MSRITLFVRIVALGIALSSSHASGQVVVERLDIQQPRSFGYRVGDKFERLIVLQLRKPYELVLSSLPEPGRLSSWLAIEDPKIETRRKAASTRYRIRLVYQIVNIDPAYSDLPLPHIDLRYTNGEETLKALVPASRFSVSPLLDSDALTLRPDQAPQLARQSYWRLVIHAALLCASLAGIALLYWGSPLQRTKRPFSAAYRDLQKYRHNSWDDDSQSAALQTIHKAFNETAGKTVFADTLEPFFDEHAEFRSAREAINHYFQKSRNFFFDRGEQEGSSLSELIALVKACRDIERGLA